MIIDLQTAISINPELEREDILAYEELVRSYTNNHFHRPNFEADITEILHNGIRAQTDLFKVNDTIEISGSRYNDGFYHASSIQDDLIILYADLIPERNVEATVYQTMYPPDVKAGFKKVLKYETKMLDKFGVKSERISRMSRTYFAPGETGQSVNGLPPHLFDFLEPYKKLRWA